MGKVIRPSYQKEFSVGLLIMIFVVSFFLSTQVFITHSSDAEDGLNLYLGMFLVSTCVIIMVLVLWEELFFAVKIKPVGGGFVFRNHSTKLITQILIYCAIPVIFVFIYLEYEVNHIRYFIWAGICTIVPIAGKLLSGIKNYNDFLRLTTSEIQYKNNEKEGTYQLKDIQQITLIKDERTVLHKIQLSTPGEQVIIDLDEMELEAFYIAIDQFLNANYKSLIKGKTAA
jgi:hypothetical protein